MIDGNLYMYYTGNNKHNGIRTSSQCLAVSNDGIRFLKQGPVFSTPRGNIDGEKIVFSNISRCFHLSVDLKDCKKSKQIKIHSNEWRFEYNSENKTGLFARNSWVSESEEIRLFNLESFENIEIWSDNSSLEIFINGGQDVLSSRIFPKTDVLSLCIEGAGLYSSVQLNEILTV